MKISNILLGGHEPKIVIPDYKSYTVGNHTPELQELQRKLAAKGLKDPWIRNEVWRYDLNERVLTPNPWGQLARYIFRGFVPGLVLASISAVLWWEYDKKLSAKHGHHGHGGHH